jgi:hypothetical protein
VDRLGRAVARPLARRGLRRVDVAVETVAFPLQVESKDELWTGLVAGTVRVRPMILGQSAEMQRAIRTHFDELLEEYRTEDGFDVAVSVKLASGRTPSLR